MPSAVAWRSSCWTSRTLAGVRNFTLAVGLLLNFSCPSSPRGYALSLQEVKLEQLFLIYVLEEYVDDVKRRHTRCVGLGASEGFYISKNMHHVWSKPDLLLRLQLNRNQVVCTLWKALLNDQNPRLEVLVESNREALVR